MKPLSSVLSFASASVVAAICLGILLSGLRASAGWIALACGMLAGVVAWRTTQSNRDLSFGFWDWAVLAVFALASLRAFLWIVYPRGDEISFSRQTTSETFPSISISLAILQVESAFGQRAQF